MLSVTGLQRVEVSCGRDMQRQPSKTQALNDLRDGIEIRVLGDSLQDRLHLDRLFLIRGLPPSYL